MASNVREQRRRRIVDRGSDRLALITGQIRNLQDSPCSSPYASAAPAPHHAHTESSPPILIPHFDFLSQFNADPGNADHDSGSEILKKMSNSGVSEDSPRQKTEPRLRKCVTGPEIARSPAASRMNITQTVKSQVPNTAQMISNHLAVFSSKRIHSCIAASEMKRAICSLIIASLVVISHVDYPLLGFNIISSESLILSRPLYMLLLTDVTIVLARLYRERENDGPEEPDREGEKAVKEDDGDSWTGAVKLLERGLVLYQALRGVFIDCSIYLVVVISGISLV